MITARKRLAVARFWFEGNAFSPLQTTLASFREREWTSGRAALGAARGTESELAAVAEFADAHPKWEVTVLRCCSANPGGPIDDDAYAAIRDEILAGLTGQRWDAVYLSLHGAAIARGEAAPDLALVRAAAAAARCPVGASFDLHANLDPAIATHLAAASSYRTYPHVDMKATAARVLDQLVRAVAGETRPRVVVHPLRLLLPSFNMRTSAGPMADAEAAARKLERGSVLDVAVFGGFPYADTPSTGASVLAVADGDAAIAAEAAAAIATMLRARADEFTPRLVAAEEGIRLALSAPPGLVAVTDPADNPLSGGAADTPGLLRALLAVRPGAPTVFAYFADEAVVAQARAAGEGAKLAVVLGGKRSAAFGSGVAASARVARLCRARFVNEGPMERGLAVDLGNSAVLDVDGVQVIVTSRVGAANDPAFFAAHGVDLAATRLLCAKAKNHFRAAFEPLCARIFDVDCPGPASADLRSLPFRNVQVLPSPGASRERGQG
ncbi:MAG: M81 family metallopeptidase [Betaproteobacteria bacterium]|nr:M81 family metallopeptidase [Betaproteobacteria bacterium]